jgi:hypothetical protein
MKSAAFVDKGFSRRPVAMDIELLTKDSFACPTPYPNPAHPDTACFYARALAALKASFKES